jgi:hypothetical protein
MKCRLAVVLAAAGALFAGACDSASEQAPVTGRTASGEVRTVLPTWISGLRVIDDKKDIGSCGGSIKIPLVPGAEALTRTLREQVTTFGFCGQDVSFDFLVASGDVVGVQTTSQYPTAVGSALAFATYWYDGRARKVVPALGMIKGGSVARYVRLVEKALRARAGADPATAKASLEDPIFREMTLDNLAFAENGSLVAIFDPGEVAVTAAGRQEVTVPRAQVAPLLSEFGRRVQRQAMHPGHSLELGG